MSTYDERVALRKGMYQAWAVWDEVHADTDAERFATEKLKHAAAALEEALIELDREEAKKGVPT